MFCFGNHSSLKMADQCMDSTDRIFCSYVYTYDFHPTTEYCSHPELCPNCSVDSCGCGDSFAMVKRKQNAVCAICKYSWFARMNVLWKGWCMEFVSFDLLLLFSLSCSHLSLHKLLWNCPHNSVDSLNQNCGLRVCYVHFDFIKSSTFLFINNVLLIIGYW